MLNPWLSFSLQAALFGWKTQSIAVDQMMRMTGVGMSDRSAAGVLKVSAVPRAEPQVAAAAAVSPVQAMTSAKDRELRTVMRKASKMEKKRSLRSKRRRSK